PACHRPAGPRWGGPQSAISHLSGVGPDIYLISLSLKLEGRGTFSAAVGPAGYLIVIYIYPQVVKDMLLFSEW
ncbi:hypothetical protein L9F63_026042, partial [Diploptera punctata]